MFAFGSYIVRAGTCFVAGCAIKTFIAVTVGVSCCQGDGSALERSEFNLERSSTSRGKCDHETPRLCTCEDVARQTMPRVLEHGQTSMGDFRPRCDVRVDVCGRGGCQEGEGK